MGAWAAWIVLAAAPLSAAPPAAPAGAPGGEPSAQIVVASAIAGHQPSGAGFQFGSEQAVYCWTRVRGENGRAIKHVWKRSGHVIREVTLKVGADDFRTWSKKETLWPGHWTIAVVDQDGRALGPEISFIVADAFDAAPGYRVEIRDVSESKLEAVLVAADDASLAAYSPRAAVLSVTSASGNLLKAEAPAGPPAAADVAELVPGEKPQFTLPLPRVPQADEAFDLSFQAYLVGPGRADRTSVLKLRGVPNPARLEVWAATRRRLLAASDSRAAR